MQTVEDVVALGGQSQSPSLSGRVLTRCGLEKYERNSPPTITINAITVFSFQDSNMIVPHAKRCGIQVQVYAARTLRQIDLRTLGPSAPIHVNF